MEKVINSLTDAFTKLNSSFKESPVTFIMLFLMAISAYFMYSQAEYIAKLLPNPQEESEMFNKAIERDELINSTLEDYRQFYNAKGMVIAQFHNGRYDLTNLPFTNVSITYYVGDTNASDSIIYESRPLSTMTQIMKAIWKSPSGPQCVARQVEDLKDKAYRQRMEETGLRFITICPLINIRDYPIGYVSVGYDFVPSKQEQDVLLDYQKTLASRLSGYLQAGEVRNVKN